MNITEGNAVSLILRALQGDASVNPDDVADAAMALKARIQAALSASPDVSEGLVIANVVTLQVQTNGVAEATEEPEPEPEAEAKSEPVKLTGRAKREYDKRVAAQTAPAKTVGIEDGRVVVKDQEPEPAGV